MDTFLEEFLYIFIWKGIKIPWVLHIYPILYPLGIFLGWKLQNLIAEAWGFIFLITASPERGSPWRVQQILDTIHVRGSLWLSSL